MSDRRAQNLRRRLAEAQNHRCAYCGLRLTDAPGRADTATLDHVIPRANGGGTSYTNCVAACARCNRLRGCLAAYQFFNLVWAPWGRRGRGLERFARAENRKLVRTFARSARAWAARPPTR